MGDFGLISEAIIGAAIDVHRQIGPGLFESIYEACLEHELALRAFAWSVRRRCRSSTKT